MKVSPATIRLWSGLIAVSVLLHFVSFVTVVEFSPEVVRQDRTAVKMRVVEQPKPEKKPDPPKDPPKPPPKPKEKKPPEKKLTERVKPQKDPPKEQPKPIMGLDPSALDPNGKGIAAPAGNTLMMPDDGKRAKPEDVQAFTGDLSSDARLLRDSLRKIEYTETAVDAALEGKYTVDVFVDEKGVVTSAELRKKIGHGMDEKVLEVARGARYAPRRTKTGVAESGWTEIQFVLQLP